MFLNKPIPKKERQSSGNQKVLKTLKQINISTLDVDMIYQLTIIEFNPTTSTRPLQGVPKGNQDRDLQLSLFKYFNKKCGKRMDRP